MHIACQYGHFFERRSHSKSDGKQEFVISQGKETLIERVRDLFTCTSNVFIHNKHFDL
jgi:hypothetical protein